jgi:hypothetical protein
MDFENHFIDDDDNEVIIVSRRSLTQKSVNRRTMFMYAIVVALLLALVYWIFKVHVSVPRFAQKYSSSQLCSAAFAIVRDDKLPLLLHAMPPLLKLPRWRQTMFENVGFGRWTRAREMHRRQLPTSFRQLRRHLPTKFDNATLQCTPRPCLLIQLKQRTASTKRR